jgi:hypothetical protein
MVIAHYTARPHLYNPDRFFWLHAVTPPALSRRLAWDRYNEALIEMGAPLSPSLSLDQLR